MSRLLPVALALALGSAAAQATVCTVSAPDACVNTFQLYSDPAGIELLAEVVYFGPVIKLHHLVRFNNGDSLANVIWTAADGSVLVHGENMLGLFNGWYSWSSELVGVLLPNPSVALLTGTADFTGTIPRPGDCLGGRCPAKYYDWSDEGQRRSGGTASRLPAEGVTETAGAMQSVRPSTTEPDELVFTDELRFSTRVEAEAGGWRYHYSFQNLTDHEVAFDLAGLGFEGIADPDSTNTMSLWSALAPGLRSVTPTVARAANGSLASGRFEALVPALAVPEPGVPMLLLAGLAVVLRRSARRRR